ncbi:MAG: hypothetical protein RRY53_05585, partial [Pseudoflavonifractor sp.]
DPLTRYYPLNIKDITVDGLKNGASFQVPANHQSASGSVEIAPKQIANPEYDATTNPTVPQAIPGITVQVKALLNTLGVSFAEDGVTVKDSVSTQVRVNGHLAVPTVANPVVGTLVTYTVDLPMSTWSDRFDIRVDYPLGTPISATAPADYVMQNTSYVLYVTDSEHAPKTPLVDQKGQPVRYSAADLAQIADPAGLADFKKAHPTVVVPAVVATVQLGDFMMTGVPLTGPQLGQINLDENEGSVDSGTFTTKFYGDVFQYRATASAGGFSVSASIMDAQGNAVTTRPTYIEVYDELGSRYTISNTSANFVKFKFPVDAKGVRQIMTLFFRVIQYTDSGFEMISEYQLMVYPSSEPLVDNLYLQKAKLQGLFNTLDHSYDGRVYKRQNDFAVYAQAEYFDQGDTAWRDGKLEMKAVYKKLVPYTTTVNGTPV